MTENEFCKLLENCYGPICGPTTDEPLVLDRAVKIMKQRLSDLMDNIKSEDVVGAVVIAFSQYSAILQGSDGRIYRMVSSEQSGGWVEIVQDYEQTFKWIEARDVLSKVFSPESVLEFRWLQTEARGLARLRRSRLERNAGLSNAKPS